MSEPVDAAERAEESEPPHGHQRMRVSFNYLLVLLLLIVIAAGVLELIPANVYVLLPGQALPVSPMIAVKGHPARVKSGKLFLTDVSLYKADHLLVELWGRIQPDSEIQPAANVAGGLSAKQFNTYNLSLMDDSIHQAEAAALNTIPGDHPHYASTGPRIAFVIAGLPAHHVLRAGDVVLAVNGHRTKRSSQVAPYVKSLRPGETVHLRIIRNGKERSVSVKSVPSTNGQPAKNGKKALIGIEMQDQIVFPVKINVNPGNIGGPSGGLMFSLGIIQRLVPRDIARGCRVAGTGTIDFAGNVGVIGGAAQKVVAAENAGAQYFLVPADPTNLGPARQHAHNIKVVPVKTLAQALAFLKTIKPCR
ncbi:MAG: YlbL family protein [Chloroflexota bacterium]